MNLANRRAEENQDSGPGKGPYTGRELYLQAAAQISWQSESI